jgi:hypothetical protein
MPATPQDPWSLDEDEVATASLEEALAHDAYWARTHARENYFRVGLDYEDYAPAYCVGYVGHTQYGGAFEEAEKSLLANWLRIKGDSRLDLDEARMAIRAAWERRAALHATADERWADMLRRLLESANTWLDRAEDLLGGARRPVSRPYARRPQPSSLARH